MMPQICLLIVALLSCVSALLIPSPIKSLSLQNLPKLKLKNNNIALIAYSTYIASTPLNVFADEGGGGASTAVLVPLVISLLTIGPFLYYQQ